MSEKQVDKLLHVQRGAIRSMLYEHIEDKELENRYKLITKASQVKDIKETLKRVEKQVLVDIVRKSPEITQEDIDLCFEENRFSRRPNFQLFLIRPFDPTITSDKFMSKNKNEQAVEKLNGSFSNIVFKNDVIKNLKATDQSPVQEDTLEIAFSYAERYNYIDPQTEDNNSIYELKYGFIWINFTQRFISISVPSDSLTAPIARSIGDAFDCFTTSINITQKVIDNNFANEDMKRTTYYSAKPPEGMPEKINVADREMGKKLNHVPELETYERPSSVYQESIDDEFITTLGINCNKGKIYLTRQLKASQMRRWGLWRIQQVMTYINGIYDHNDLDELFKTIGIDEDEELKEFAYTSQERKAVLSVVKAIIVCKKKGETRYKLIDESPDALFQQLRKHTTQYFHPYCDSCGNYTEVACPNCGHSDMLTIQVKKSEPSVTCGLCHEPLDMKKVACTMDHSIRVASWYDGVLLTPKSRLIQMVKKLIQKYFTEDGYNDAEEYFYLQNSELIYSVSKSSKVLYRIEEIEALKPVWSRKITDKKTAEITELLEIIKEKCSKHDNDGCRACQKEKTIHCIMKPFITFTDHQLHPHHGQEYGDVNFPLTISGKEMMFVGLAKSYEKKPITESSSKGREMLQQFVAKCMDETVQVLGLIVAAQVDAGLIAKFHDLARKYGKKVMMWNFPELIKVMDYAMNKYKLSAETVKTTMITDYRKMKRSRKVVDDEDEADAS